MTTVRTPCPLVRSVLPSGPQCCLYPCTIWAWVTLPATSTVQHAAFRLTRVHGAVASHDVRCASTFPCPGFGWHCKCLCVLVSDETTKAFLMTKGCTSMCFSSGFTACGPGWYTGCIAVRPLHPGPQSQPGSAAHTTGSKGVAETRAPVHVLVPPCWSDEALVFLRYYCRLCGLQLHRSCLIPPPPCAPPPSFLPLPPPQVAPLRHLSGRTRLLHPTARWRAHRPSAIRQRIRLWRISLSLLPSLRPCCCSSG